MTVACDGFSAHPFAAALLIAIVALSAVGKIRSIEPDISVICHPPYGNASCTETRRSAWLDLASIFVALSGLAGAAAIIVAHRRRAQALKSIVRIYALCLGTTLVLYGGLVVLALTLA